MQALTLRATLSSVYETVRFKGRPSDLFRVLALDLLAVAAVQVLAGCSAPPVAVSGACPSLPVYDAALQTKAADEVAAMPAGSVVAEVLLPDYGSMRDAVRACMAARDAH